MKKREINYSTSSIPQLKKSIILSCVYSIFMIAVVIFCILLYLYADKNDIVLEKLEKIALFVTILFVAMFLAWQAFKLIYNYVIVLKLRRDGFISRSKVVFDFSNRHSMGNTIRLMTYILSTITSVLVFGFGTYIVLRYIFADSINFYLPFLVAMLIANAYACINIEEEKDLNLTY